MVAEVARPVVCLGEEGMKGTFYVVGVGPGDPQLLTLKAAKVLDACETWFVPSAFENGGSMALKIASGAVDASGKTILSHRFPMKQVRRALAPDPEVKNAWQTAAKTILQRLDDGFDVVFPTLGDPAIYSTGFYVCETLKEFGASFKMQIIPGVSALGASSAVSGLPLCLGDERLVVIPATFADQQIRKIVESCDCAVFMKVHKVMPRLVALLKDMDLLSKAVLVERCSLEDERIWTDVREVVDRKIHYFSTMVVRK
jgi:precorrin-2/cobalt-factor-2 C20-methyltransferase